MPERRQLPGPSVPIDGYKLIRRFARNEDLSISEAIRQLLKESPRLIEFARQLGVSVDLLDVAGWGGPRDKDEEDEPPIAATVRPKLPLTVLKKTAVQAKEEPHYEPITE